MILGFRLRELRKENRMSQEELGKILGVTKVSISGYENGTRVPSMDILLKILDVFRVPADYLLGRELNAVAEDDEEHLPVNLALADIEIIRILRGKPGLYNQVASDPRRFFNSIVKKNI